MIPRYETPVISALWTDEYKFQTYLKVELAILNALEGEKIPRGITRKIEAQAKINPERISEIEKVVQHDVVAFCTSITENLSPEIGKFFHFGVTSSDIIDTALTLQVKASLEHILEALKETKGALKEKALQFKNVISMGRSHGMLAEPMSFGQKFLGHYCEFSRRLHDLEHFYQHELTGQFSGAVGNYTILDSKAEETAIKLLGLKVEPVSTQVIPRDRLAKLISLTVLLAQAIERFAVEIRHLHRSEVGAVHEGFKKGQKGSSIMPHKKNPIAAENLTGMCRVLRSHLSIALDNIVLWHERDISHSSAERIFLPDHFGLLYYSLKRLTRTLQNLEVHVESIERQVFSHFDYLSSFYLHFLIENTDLKREELYEIIQGAAFAAKEAQEFYQAILKEAEGRGVSLDSLPSPTHQQLKNLYLKEVEAVFSRTLTTYA